MQLLFFLNLEMLTLSPLTAPMTPTYIGIDKY